MSVLLFDRLEPTPGRLTPLVADDREGEAVPVAWLMDPAGVSGRRILSAVRNSTADMAAACSASCISTAQIQLAQ